MNQTKELITALANKIIWLDRPHRQTLLDNVDRLNQHGQAQLVKILTEAQDEQARYLKKRLQTDPLFLIHLDAQVKSLVKQDREQKIRVTTNQEQQAAEDLINHEL